MSIVTYPLNEVDYEGSDAELFHCTRSSGIYANDDFDFSVTGTDSSITIGTGIGWIRNSRFSGKVIAQKSATALDLGISDATYPRIDAVVLQFDAATNKTALIAKRGVAASNPTPPEVVRTESRYELHIYHVRRAAGTAVIAPSDVTDLRLDAAYCGLMADSVTHIDTEAIRVQIEKFINDLEEELAAVKEGTAFCTKTDLSKTLESYSKIDHKHDTTYAKLQHDHTGVYAPVNHSHDDSYLKTTGGELSGTVKLRGIHLTPGVDYGTEFPSDAEEGRLFWILGVSGDG